VYILVLAGFATVPRPLDLPTGALLYSLLSFSNIVVVAGIRRFVGLPPFARWMAIPPLLTGGGFVFGYVVGWYRGVSASASASDFGATGMTLSMLLLGIAVLRGSGESDHGRRIAGGALLGYFGGYGIAMVAKIFGVAAIETLMSITMVVDQMLLIILNLGLLAMPGERAIRVLSEKADRDPLTGARSRAWLAGRAGKLFVPGIGVILIDVDHFKRINDRHGHATGDATLIHIVRRMADAVRALDGWIVRMGGDEFIVIAPFADDAAIADLAERLRAIVTVPAIEAPSCTISMGWARVCPEDDRLDRVIARADEALYRAKAAGRNRVAA
jgi:diguanylate cyclase (GGDEF)-like protein